MFNKRLFSLVRHSRTAFVITVLAGFFAGWLTIGQAWTLSQSVKAAFLDTLTLDDIAPTLRLLLIFIIGRAIMAWLGEISAQAVAIKIKDNLRNQLIAHLQKLGPAYTRRERSGELTAAAVEGIGALDAYFSQYLPQLIISTLVPVSVLIFVFPIDLLSGIILFITAPLIPLFMYLIGKGAEVVTKRQYDTLSRLSAHFLDSLQGLTTLKLFGQSKAHAHTIEKISHQFKDTTLSVLRITFLSALALELLATLSTAVIAVEIGLRLLYARMEFQPALFLLILAPEFYLPLRMLGLRFHAGMAGTSAAQRIFEILDIENREQKIEKGETAERFTGIKLTNLSFTYPDESRPALENINLRIEAKQRIALVGPSGAGKSTLVNLLLGFIQPTSGSIACDTDTAKNIAWVPQKPYLFHESIANNLRLGNPDATSDQLEKAAKAANLHEFIASLPDGYETIIGEGGTRLSGGQAQRLALARAFLVKAPILILDEPTSSLDPESETLLEASTRQLMQERTVITIAHRLNTIFQSDRIVVLDKGGIVEQGTHSELLAKNGLYARMVKTLDISPNTLGASSKAPISHTHPGPLSALPLKPEVHSKSILLRLLAFLNSSWAQVALSVMLGALTIGSNIALMGTSAWLISTAALHPSVAELQVAIVGVRFFGITRGVFRYLERLVSHGVTFNLLARLRTWFYKALEPLAPARLMSYRAGDLLSRIIADVNMLENFYIRVVAPPIVAVAITLGISLYLNHYDLLMALTLLGIMLVTGFALPLLTQIVSHAPGKQLVIEYAELQTRLIDTIQGLPDLLAFGRADAQAKLLADQSATHAKTERKLAAINAVNTGLTTFLPHFSLWIVLVLAIPLVNAGHIPGVLLATLGLMSLASFEAVNPLPLAAQMLESTRASARRLFEIVDARPIVDESGNPNPGLDTVQSAALQVSNLTFAYPHTTTPALGNISFELRAGRSLALVGPSGAGKSTLANLLLRFWEYEQGNITLNDQELHAYAPDDVRRHFAVIGQSSYFFNTTIRDNLLLANNQATDKDIETAAQQAQIQTFIKSLSKGYKTIIGEQGLRLSGGERQRLAIARALLKNAPILMLDEPTANLDPLTERQVLETLFGLMAGRTSILITHRLIGLENMDEILVLDNGQIVERGKHAQLLAQNGLYHRLWKLQNRILDA